MIVLTADRPPELRDIGAGQTIDQLKLYGDAVRWFCEVGTHEADDEGLLQFPLSRLPRLRQRDRRPAARPRTFRPLAGAARPGPDRRRRHRRGSACAGGPG